MDCNLLYSNQTDASACCSNRRHSVCILVFTSARPQLTIFWSDVVVSPTVVGTRSEILKCCSRSTGGFPCHGQLFKWVLALNPSALVSNPLSLAFMEHGVIIWPSGNRRYCHCDKYVSGIATAADRVPEVRILMHLRCHIHVLNGSLRLINALTHRSVPQD
jgi:hypothetical protein